MVDQTPQAVSGISSPDAVRVVIFINNQMVHCPLNALLAHYQNKTFTPVITAETGTITTATASMNYAVVERRVIFEVSITITTAGTGAGNIRFSLPVPPAAVAGISGQESAVTGFAVAGTVSTTGLGSVLKYDGTTIIASGRTVRVSGSYLT